MLSNLINLEDLIEMKGEHYPSQISQLAIGVNGSCYSGTKKMMYSK